jgi:hypothetical protein
MPWEYEPAGPFRVLNSDGEWVFDVADLVDAMHRFVQLCLPPIPHGTAVVLDADGVIVAGYDWDLMEGWRGVRAGFDALASHRAVDPLHVELWAIEAQVDR